MKHRQNIVMLLLLILLSSAVLALAGLPGSVLGQMTIPTRTPTPNPGEPTDPPPLPTDDNGGGNNTPSPTDPPGQSSSTPSSGPSNTPIAPGSTQAPTGTSQPPVTVTGNASPTQSGAVGTLPATWTVTASPTPIDKEIAPGTTPISFPVVATAFPKAELCGVPPTFTTLIRTEVYSGPGEDYDLIETLAIDETRPIVGRAIYGSWWVIQLDGKFNQAWINDNSGIAHGNTRNVPDVPSPKINGVTPTPGIKWDPTPVHDCELTPTATATIPGDQEDHIVSGVIIDDGGASPQDTVDPSEPDFDTNQQNLVAPTAVPLDIPTAAPTPNLLPIAGLVLIIAAVFVALFLRRNPGGGEPSA